MSGEDYQRGCAADLREFRSVNALSEWPTVAQLVEQPLKVDVHEVIARLMKKIPRKKAR